MANTSTGLRKYLQSNWNRLQGQGVGAVLARAASGSFAIMVLAVPLAFIVNILLARYLGVTQYGIYIYAITWINLLELICKLGFGTSLLRFIPAYNAKGEWGLLRGILKRSTQYVLVASFTIGIFASIAVWFLYYRIGYEQAVTFWISFLVLLIAVLADLRSAALRSFKRVVKAALPVSILQRLTIVSLASICYMYMQESLNAPLVMSFTLIGSFIAFAIGSVWLFKALPLQLKEVVSEFHGKEWIKVSLPLFFMSGMSLIINQTGIVLVGIILNSDQAGIYAVAARVANLVILGLMATNTIVAPMVSELYTTGQHRQLQRLITLAARGVSVFTITVSICIACLGKLILGMFGEEFVAGYEILVVLLCGQIINALAGSVGLLMTMTGHQDDAAKILGVSALLSIILNTILIPTAGIMGAAIATAITTIFWNLNMLIYVWRRLNINPTILKRLETSL